MSYKFKTLTHNGLEFPPEYEAKGYHINGEILSPLAEEMIVNYAAKLETEYVKSDILNKNFYKCLKSELTPKQSALKFPEDFMPLMKEIFKNLQKEKDAKTLYKKEHKAEIEKEKAEKKEFYGYAMLDGSKQSLGSYLVEGPGIFIGRGNSPLTGLWKYRVRPEDVIINFVSKTEEPPKAPEGHNWKEVEHNRNALHVALYKENIGNVTEKIKEVRFGNNSDVKAEADMHKFDKAVVLLQNWDVMQKYIKDNLTNTDRKIAECALISWLIQTTSIRIGNERDETTQSTDVVGASTLKCDNIIAESNKMFLHFIGKDSIEFKNEYDIPVYIEKAINKCKKGKKSTDNVFSVDSNDVKGFLDKCVKGCTPKLFRTAWASKLLVDAIKEQGVKKSWTVAQKVHAFDMASLEVAKKLNHKKAVSKSYGGQMEKLDSRIDESGTKLKELEKKIKSEVKELDKRIARAKDANNDAGVKKYKADKKKKLERLENAIRKFNELQMKRDFKSQTSEIAINTARTNYSTPKIVYSFCKDMDVPVEKIYSKSLKEKFSWAEDVSKDYWKKYPNV